MCGLSEQKCTEWMEQEGERTWRGHQARVPGCH